MGVKIIASSVGVVVLAAFVDLFLLVLMLKISNALRWEWFFLPCLWLSYEDKVNESPYGQWRFQSFDSWLNWVL